jgi:hypothetical protein
MVSLPRLLPICPEIRQRSERYMQSPSTQVRKGRSEIRKLVLKFHDRAEL